MMSAKCKVQSAKLFYQLSNINGQNIRCYLSVNKGQKTSDKGQAGFTLLELIITLFVISILVMGTIPLTQNAAKRQKELRLRETLRMIRNAIDEFHRDTIGACPQGALTTTNPAGGISQGGGRLPGGFGGKTPPLIRAAASLLTIVRFSTLKITTVFRRV